VWRSDLTRIPGLILFLLLRNLRGHKIQGDGNQSEYLRNSLPKVVVRHHDEEGQGSLCYQKH